MSWARPPKLGLLGRRTNSCSQFFNALLGLLGDAQNDWQTSAPLVVETPSIGRVKVSARRSHRGRVLHVEKFELEPPDSRAAAGKLQGVAVCLNAVGASRAPWTAPAVKTPSGERSQPRRRQAVLLRLRWLLRSPRPDNYLVHEPCSRS